MLGIDIVDLKKFEKKLENNYFKENIFSNEEINYCQQKENPVQSFAGIFAAKEAAIKAYNLDISYILRKKIEILHKDSKPMLYINNKFLNSKYLSISHDGSYAVAICLLNKNEIVFDKQILDLLPDRNEESHKGNYGRVATLGGSKGMAGSVFMASEAALKTGAGLSYIICPSSISTILQIKANEQIIKEIDCESFKYNPEISASITKELKNMDTLCLGPGMAREENLEILVKDIVKNFDGKILIDADGLNAISKDLSILELDKDFILTPHMMEFSRLIKKDISYTEKHKKELAKNFAKKYSLVLVLKGHKTIITDGNVFYENTTGNAGMATAGSGDVLSGIISSLMVRINCLDAAILGVYVHGLAGDFAKEKLGEESMTASDIISNLHEVFKLKRGNNA